MRHNQTQMYTLQLERELKMICDIDGLSHEQNFEEYKPAIIQLAEEEAMHSPRMKRLLTDHTSELERVDDGKRHKFLLIKYKNHRQQVPLGNFTPLGDCCCSGDSKD